MPFQRNALASRRNAPPTSIPWIAAWLLLATWEPLGVAETAGAGAPDDRGSPWPRHVIDDSSRGADGVRLADIDGDGNLDIVTGWEEGGITRVYINPGHEKAAKPWPAVTVGSTPNVEDAAFVDLDADGRTDVVSCCEGRTRTMFVHWAPRRPEDLLESEAWTTEPIPASRGRMMWMYSVPLSLDGRHGVDLVAAGKGRNCQIGWWQAPATPRNLDLWTWHPISPAGWVMSLRAVDLDGDADCDLLVTDRKGPLRGCRWLENPGSSGRQTEPWPSHLLGGHDHEVMFLTLADLDRDGSIEVVCATRDNGLLLFQRGPDPREPWGSEVVALPANVGTGKAVEVGDLDLDGRADLVFSCENARGQKSGVLGLFARGDAGTSRWAAREISGPVGIKFDRIELVDLDADGDLDILACEESHPHEGTRRGLGVFWYENPLAH